MSSVIERRESATSRNQMAGSRLLLISGLSFAVVLLGRPFCALTHMATYTVDPAELKVYNNGGLIIRHVSPPYSARFKYPLHDWPLGKVAVKFTDTSFAAIFFVAILATALVGVLLIFAARPDTLWSVPVTGPGDFANGLIWAGPLAVVALRTRCAAAARPA